MRILVVEDDVVILKGLESKLIASHYAVDTALDGATALELLFVNSYDAILLDVNLPDMSGFDICRTVRQENVGTPIIMVTARDEVLDKIAGLDNGADDYISKPFDYDELLARIRAVLRRNEGRAAPKLAFKDILVEPALFEVKVDGNILELTKKEYGILHFLLVSHPAPVSLEAIIDHVWNDDVNPFTNAARVHIANLRKKIHAVSTVRIETRKEVGYYLE